MSDDTTNTEGSGSTGNPGAPPREAERVGFCQDCGKPLSHVTVRTVGAGVFCEPCLAARVGATDPSSGYATPPPYTAVQPQAAASGEPSPLMAALLGFIPGVGAMYNGQFAKGIVHLIIFAILVSLSDNVNGIFGLLVAGWVFYMVFEAYHTAIARRDGLPLPNSFGFNDIGERLGFGRAWGTVDPTRSAAASAQQNPLVTPIVEPVTGTTSVPVSPVPVGRSSGWVGYVPPSAFATSPPVASAAPWGQSSYNETYTGAPQGAYGEGVPLAAGITPEIETRRFPAGALWLIGLGVLILAANLLPDWRVTGRWWPPVLFAGLAAWTFTRRLRSSARTVCIIRWPVILMVLAVMSALHAAYFAITFGLVCSVLLIVFGALLLLERTAGASPVYSSPVPATEYSGTASVAGAQAEETQSRAVRAPATENFVRPDPDDGTKGEQ